MIRIDYTLLHLADPQFMANIGEPPPAIAPMPDGRIRPYYGELVSYKYKRDRIRDYKSKKNLNSLWPLFNVNGRKFMTTSYGPACPKPSNHAVWPTDYSRHNIDDNGTQNPVRPNDEWSTDSQQRHNETRSSDISKQPNNATWPHAETAQNLVRPNDEWSTDSQQRNNETRSSDISKQPNNATWPHAETAQNLVRPNDEWSTDSQQRNNETRSSDISKQPNNATWPHAETAQNLVRPNDEWSTDSQQRNNETRSSDISKQLNNATWPHAETAQNLVRPNDEWSTDSQQRNNETRSSDISKQPNNATWPHAETPLNLAQPNETRSSNSNDTKDNHSNTNNEEHKNNGYRPLDDGVDEVIMDEELPQNHSLPAAYAMWRDLAKFMSERAFHWKEAEFEFRRDRAAIIHEIQLEQMRNGLLEIALDAYHRQEELVEMQKLIRRHSDPTL